MAKEIDICIGGVVKKVKTVPIRIGGVTKEAKKGFCGVGGAVKEFFNSEFVLYDNGNNIYGLTVYYPYSSNYISYGYFGSGYINIDYGSFGVGAFKIPAINYSEYTKLNITLYFNPPEDANYPAIYFRKAGGNTDDYLLKYYKHSKSCNEGTYTFTIDISSVSYEGEATIGFGAQESTGSDCYASGSGSLPDFYIYKIWLE